MKSLMVLLCVVLAGCGSIEKYRLRVVADAPATPPRPAPSEGVRVTYLGTNGYVLESGGTRILVDPYFTRASVAAIALGLPFVEPSSEVVKYLPRLPRKVDAILVTHGHFDHLLDVPAVARHTGGKVIASPTSVYLARAAGVPAGQCRPVLEGDTERAGGAKIRVLKAAHDCVVLPGFVPWDGDLTAEPKKAPRRPGDWLCGEPLAFLIELGGQRIYVDSGGTPEVLPPAGLGRVDLAILGVALPDSRERIGATLDLLRPRYFLPSHQDNFFRPLRWGFHFGPLTNIAEVLKIAEARRRKLILLDHFAPWTLR